MTVGVTKTLIKAESASAEHFGAINETFVWRVIYGDKTQTVSPRVAIADLINQGFEGIAARPGRPLVVDNVTVDTDLTTRTVDVTCNEQGGLDVVVGCTRYDWGGASNTVGDPAVRVLATPYTQTVQAWRVNPLLPIMNDVAAEFDDADWGGDGSTGLNGVPTGTSAPTAASPDDGTYRPAGDIGGTPVDWNGNPLQLTLPAMRIEVDVLRRGGYIQVNGTGSLDALRPGVILDYIGKRNTTSIFGLPVGSVLFDQVNRTRLDGEWTVCTFSFLWHPWRHAEQVPRPTYGTKAGTMAYEGDPRGIQHTRGVYWKQPFLLGADFTTANALFTTTELALIEDFMVSVVPSP